MKDVVYFELNNWCRGRDYPNTEPFITWIGNDKDIYFNNEEWVKENKLCVVRDIVDTSVNYCITATKEWVNKNCPELLTAYKEYLRYPDEDGDIETDLGSYFLWYDEDNIGVTYVD